MNATTAPDADYHLKRLVDQVSAMLAYWDRDLRCRFANRAYEAWFGVRPEDLLGTSLRDLLGPALFALNEPHIRKALAGERQLFERVVPGPDGVQRQALAEYIPDVVEGEVRGFLVQVTNLTELKETQAALQREQALRVRIEAQAGQLEGLLKERTEMLDVLAHEVRQPLHNAAAALQSAQGALSGRDDSYATDQVRQARTVLGDVLAGIDNTLAVASLLAGGGPIQREDTDIATLVAIVIADLPAAERSRVLVQHDSPLRTALMDMGLMRLALRNLLTNALKFSPPGSVVTLRITDADTPPALELEVADRGPGIAPALLPRLFTRGGHGGTRTGARGMGLGLYIVQQVMAAHGGNVALVSTGPQGTRMRLSISQADA